MGDDAHSLPVSLLQQDVAVKANHAAGTNVLSNGKPEYARIVKRADRWMMTKFHHRRHGEWGFRDVPRLLFIKEQLALGGDDLPTDIKVHAFSRGVSHVSIADKLSGRSRTYTADVEPLGLRDHTYRRRNNHFPTAQ